MRADLSSYKYLCTRMRMYMLALQVDGCGCVPIGYFNCPPYGASFVDFVEDYLGIYGRWCEGWYCKSDWINKINFQSHHFSLQLLKIYILMSDYFKSIYTFKGYWFCVIYIKKKKKNFTHGILYVNLTLRFMQPIK
jgi:hypothetical protein